MKKIKIKIHVLTVNRTRIWSTTKCNKYRPTHLGNYEKHKNMNGHAIKTVAHQQQTHE